jgi:hypothetical protein
MLLSFIGQPPRYPAPRAPRQERAYKFYEKHYYLNNLSADPNKIFDHMDGIDFNKEVKVSTFQQGEMVCQWRAINSPQGGYYCGANQPTSPNCLGINEDQADTQGYISKRVMHHHEIVARDLEALESVAARVNDNWSVITRPPHPTSGGCIQYFNSEKSKFKQVSP